MDQEAEKIVFKKKGKKNLRKRKNSDDEEPDEDVLSKIEEMKEIQRLRERSKGISLAGLAVGRKLALEEEVLSKDPFKVNSGGLVNMQNLKSGKQKPVDDAYDTSIGTQFSAETNKRDEDEEMMKYIEEELKKRKGQDSLDDIASADAAKYMTPEEAALFALPSHLRQGNAIRSEEMLSNQMLCGIPEVDLGIESKIKNIEATEEAKQKLIDEQNKKKDGPSVFVPTNYAVNFTQHNRFNIESRESDNKRRREELKQKSNGDNNSGGAKKATDDFHFDKFRKQFRKH
ncbi:C9orf78 family protein [Megaselia abdita]